MSATTKKPGTPANPSRLSSSESHSVNGSTPRSHSKSPSTASNGLNRTPSTRGPPVSARAAARKPGRSNLSMSSVPRVTNDPSEEDARAQNAALIGELKEQLQKAETASEQYRKQLGVLQMRLDEAISEQGKLEDQVHEKDSKIEALDNEIREHARQIRDLEQAHETERNAMLQDKEQQASRDEELQATIQRLKESLAQKDRINAEGERNVSRSSSFRNRASPDVDSGQFAPSTQIERSPSRNNSKLLLQKDKLIESLRLELAESQIKLVEMENMGGGRQRELEKELLEARMANARLMEDNESYQLLLSEKTLNGDFAKSDFLHDAAPDTKQAGSNLGSLADELESVGEGGDSDTRKLEAEVKALKDQNKALSLYIERIIGRLLQHEGFESILDKDEKDPPPKPQNPQAKDDQAAQTSFLQKAKSVVAPAPAPAPKGNNKPNHRHRPSSFVPPPYMGPTPHENPLTAPSIPLGRSQSTRNGHRRTRSDQADGAAAAVVGHMYRGSGVGRSTSGGPISPGISPTTMGPGSRQSGLFSGASFVSSSAGARTPSLSSQPDRKRMSGSNSVTSESNGDVGSTEGTSSPPRSISGGMTNYPGAVMTQNKLRPLRLVQENKESEEDEAARKKANRGSWVSWFNRGSTDETAKN
ncbi:hypothetical protein DTO164E3_4500 [Paecilomyces variotii]|nr:hypothetical protein DTO164E3_4500 [Paecilomyces variotii]KAJ9203333.1 hypothetical protein DTO032I3_3200 [Paecilomyces variotii]KAJ9278930.1 hypothetical protein DTO021D3_4246 [Paecilomyces variotii]KAJ9343249.1 hypothetical protein DTO027B6_4173 [Paecilomyces variotii]KAJ9384718.1 hypothetical protein DTO032I4_4540 [Paecilomyces variotii]